MIKEKLMKQSRLIKFLAGGIVSMLAAAPVVRAAAVWTNTAGGNWEDAGNWNPNVVPTNQTVTINANGTYTVTVGSSAANTVPGSFTNVEMDIQSSGVGYPTVDFTYTNTNQFVLNGAVGMHIGNATVNWNSPNAT